MLWVDDGIARNGIAKNCVFMYKVSIYKRVIKWVQNRHYLALVCGEVAGMVGGLPPIYVIIYAICCDQKIHQRFNAFYL